MVPRYDRLYVKKYPPDAYRKEVQGVVRLLQRRYGLNARKEIDKEPENDAGPEQVGFAW
jgi:hypothetical protein